MSNKASIGGIVFFLLVFGGIQAVQYAQNMRNQPLYTNVTACSPVAWSTMTATSGAFEVLLPCEPEVQKKTVESPIGTFHYYEYATDDLETEYGALYVDISEVVAGLSKGETLPKNEMLWAVRKELTQGIGSTLMTKKIISVQGQTGRAYHLELDDGRHMFMRMAMYKDGIYLWSATAKRLLASAQDELFLSSFIFTELIKTEEIEPEPEKITEPTPVYHPKQRKTLAELMQERAIEKTKAHVKYEAQALERAERLKAQRENYLEMHKDPY